MTKSTILSVTVTTSSRLLACHIIAVFIVYYLTAQQPDVGIHPVGTFRPTLVVIIEFDHRNQTLRL